MTNLCDPRLIRSLLERHGFRFSKALGQNFLIDPAIPAEIAAVSGADATCAVLEIGPGIGALTYELAGVAGLVVAVEIDRRLPPVLAETLAAFDNVEVVQGDILKLDLQALVQARFGGRTPLVCANLPYNITTPVLTALLQAGLFERLTVMVQREVALRICAAPGTPDYGAFSVFCQYHGDCEVLFDVPPDCFLPAPKVTSTVLALTPRRGKHPLIDDEALFFQVVRASFAQRRKTLLNGLSAAFSSRCSKDAIRVAVAQCALPEGIRGETLGIPEFAKLTDALKMQF